VAADGKAFRFQHRELARLVQGQGMAGQGGDAQAGQDGLLDGLIAAQFQAGTDVQGVGVKQPLDGLAGAGAGFPHDPGLLRQPRQR